MRSKIKVLQQKCRRLSRKHVAATGKKKRKKSVEKKKALKKERENIIEQLRPFLPDQTWRFVATQVRANARKSKGMRWGDADKAVALSLLHTSPKAYRMLGKLFCLPSVSTLQRVMKAVKIYPGFNENILEALKKKIPSMPSKLCVVVFDEMSLKAQLTYNAETDQVEGLEDYSQYKTCYVANYATVFMVKGLIHPWKQTLGYFLSSGSISGDILKTLITECLEKVTSIGLSVKVLVCDQGSNNRKAVQQLGVTVENPFLVHNNERVYHIYDPPHLLKNIRNNLKSSGFTVNGKQIEWGYIGQFYDRDCRRRIRMAPRLTHKHLNLPAFTNMRVRYATQVLSHSVAAGIFSMVELGAMDEDAEATADFCEKFDQLFNALNSATVKSSQPWRGALSETSGHKKFLLETREWLLSIESGSKSSSRLPCLIGWDMAIRSVLALWEELSTQGIKYLLTSRVNQDCVENLFSIIRGKGRNMDNPNPTQFRQFMRQVMVDQFLQKSNNSNCLDDGDQFLLSLGCLRTLPTEAVPAAPAPCPPSPPPVPTQSGDPMTLVFQDNEVGEMLRLAFVLPDDISTEEKNVCSYIAGYIARKVQGRISCEDCSQLLRGEIGDCPHDTLLRHKQHPGLPEDGGLVIPSRALATAVADMEVVYRRSVDLIFKEKLHTRMSSRLREAVTLSCDRVGCNFVHIVVHLYTTIRIHFTLKVKNREMAEQKRQNRKLLKLSHL